MKKIILILFLILISYQAFAVDRVIDPDIPVSSDLQGQEQNYGTLAISVFTIIVLGFSGIGSFVIILGICYYLLRSVLGSSF